MGTDFYNIIGSMAYNVASYAMSKTRTKVPHTYATLPETLR